MAALERDYGDDENVQLGAVITIVEILKDDGEGQVSSDVRMRYNSPEPYRILGVVRMAEQSVIRQAGGRPPAG
jgi:hypothetical protein